MFVLPMIERALCYTTKATLRVVREIIGKRIVALAAKGERDPERLCNSALVAAAQRRSRLLVFEEVSPAIFFAFFGLPFVRSIGGPLLQNLGVGRARLDAPVDMPRYPVQPKLSYRST